MATLSGPLTAPVWITRPGLGTVFTYRDSLGSGDRQVIDVNARHRATVPEWDLLAIPSQSTVDYVIQRGGTSNRTVAWRSAWW